MAYRALALAVLSSLLVSTAGCGSGSAPIPVTGKMLWEDGQPVVNASIRFIPATEGRGKREAAGGTGKDGEFELSSYRQGDGILPGEYIIVVISSPSPDDEPIGTPGKMSSEEMMKKMKEHAEKAKQKKKPQGEKVPPIYGDPKTSPLRWTIDSKNTKIDLKLKKA